MSTPIRYFFLSLLLALSNAQADTSNTQTEKQRIISLAPHLTELLFSIGAGDRIVGTVSYSDYPPAAKQIPRIGSYNAFNSESILALKPDLILGWESGNPLKVLKQIEALGLNLKVMEIRSLPEIAEAQKKLGEWTGLQASANDAADQFLQEYQRLQQTYGNRSTVSVFYQVWHEPLRSINGQHLISDVIKLCGGHNVFHDSAAIAPLISVEGVIAADPEVIIASGMSEERPDWLDQWQEWPMIKAVAQQHLYFIPPDIIQRHSPRILQGAQSMCRHLDQARKPNE